MLLIFQYFAHLPKDALVNRKCSEAKMLGLFFCSDGKFFGQFFVSGERTCINYIREALASYDSRIVHAHSVLLLKVRLFIQPRKKKISEQELTV